MVLFRRALASLVDYVLFGGASFLAWHHQTFAQADETGNYGCSGCLLFIVNVALYLAYFAATESRFGFSPGKGLFDLRVVGANGRPPSVGQGVKRHLLDAVEFQILGVPALIAARLTGGQRLGDLWAGTRVVPASTLAD